MKALSPVPASQTAVVIQGLQNDVMDPQGALYSQPMAEAMAVAGTLENIGRLARSVREKGGLVVYMNYIIEPDGSGQPRTAPVFRRFRASGAIRRGTWGSESFHGLPPEPQDLVLEKNRVNPFYGSTLAPSLEGRGISTVIPVGTQTNMGIAAAARHAADAGYRVIVPSDASASDDTVRHQAIIDYVLVNVGEVTTTEALIELLVR